MFMCFIFIYSVIHSIYSKQLIILKLVKAYFVRVVTYAYKMFIALAPGACITKLYTYLINK